MSEKQTVWIVAGLIALFAAVSIVPPLVKRARKAPAYEGGGLGTPVNLGIVSAMDDPAVKAAVASLPPKDRAEIEKLAARCKGQPCPIFATVGNMLDYARTHATEGMAPPADWAHDDGPSAPASTGASGRSAPRFWDDTEGVIACQRKIKNASPYGAKFPWSPPAVIPSSGTSLRLVKGPVSIKSDGGAWGEFHFDCKFDPQRREVISATVY